MDLRKDFVLRALAPGENIAALCREFGISRKTAYKWIKRYRDRGVVGLDDLSRRPSRFAKAISGEMVLRILEIHRRYPRWGAKKLRVLLQRAKLSEVVPSARTIARVLDRAGAPRIRPKTRRQRELRAQAPFIAPKADRPNALWTVDFKGWWVLPTGRRAEPLTIRDAFSRKILLSKLLRSNDTRSVQREFERLFQKYGLPDVIQSDNGPPFANSRSLESLTRLAAWWIALGIEVVRSRPACPQDNGGHERMHLDLELDVAGKGAANMRKQQEELDRWVEEFNAVRPHEALGMQTPDEVYKRSARAYRGVLRPNYPAHLEMRLVGDNGMICLHRKRYYVGIALSGWNIGLQKLADDTYRVFFYDLDLGTISGGRRAARYGAVTFGN